MGRRSGGWRAWILAAWLGVAACGGEDPLGGLLARQEALLELLEGHAGAPQAAGAAAAAFMAEHGAEIAALRAEAAARSAEDREDPRRVARLVGEHQEALRRVGERTLALRKRDALMAEPRVRAALDAFRGL